MKDSEGFKKKLERYQYGQLSDEEKQQVERELEKAEAIQDYFFSLNDLPPNEELPLFDNEEVKHVQKVVRRKWLRQGIVVGLVVLLLLGGGVFLGRPVLNQLYFNPMKGASSKTYGDYELYQKIRNRLTPSDSFLEGVQIQHTGIGTYQVYEQYVDVFRNENRLEVTTIKKNKRENQVTPSSINYRSFLPPSSISTLEMFGKQPNKELADLKAKIKDLPGSSSLKVNLFFDSYKEIGLEELQTFVADRDIEHVLSVGFLSSEDSSELMAGGMAQFGLQFGDNASSYRFSEDPAYMQQRNQLNEQYPELLPANFVELETSAQTLEQHYLSMLDYLIDQEALGTEIDKINYGEFQGNDGEAAESGLVVGYPQYPEQVKEAKRVAEDKGVIAVQLTVAIQPNQFEQLLDSDFVSSVSLEGIELENNLLWQRNEF